MATLIHDTFTEDSNTALTSHDPDTNVPGNSWTTPSGTWEVFSTSDNLSPTSSAGSSWLAAIDAGVADCTITADGILPQLAMGHLRFAFRVTDANNYWYVQYDDRNNRVRLIKVDRGSETTVAMEGVTISANSTVSIRITLDGSSIVAEETSGTTDFSGFDVTDSFNQSATSHGFGARPDISETDTDVRYDNFLLQTLSAIGSRRFRPPTLSPRERANRVRGMSL